MTNSAPAPEVLERVLAPHMPGGRGRVVGCAPLDGIGASAVARKEGGYSRAWRVEVADDAGRAHEFVFRTAGADEFGHDRRADRAANLVLAFDTFGAIPDHVHALDVGFEAPEGLRSLRDAAEPYLVTTFAEGRLYAEDLRRIAAEQVASALDLERCDALARWIAALHADRLSDPVVWRRAVRDLLGHGEGIFGIVDAYGSDVPAAPPARLARIEHRCLDWRWRLRGNPERLRRTHGDFHPFNIVFSEGARFTLLDASRGCKGDPADDVTALAINYVFEPPTAPDVIATGGEDIAAVDRVLAARAVLLTRFRFPPRKRTHEARRGAGRTTGPARPGTRSRGSCARGRRSPALAWGRRMGVSDDAPSLDMAYKLVSYAGRGRIKLSPGKALLPGQKQMFRREHDGRSTGDVIAVHGESHPGRPLLSCVMKAGRRTSPPPTLDAIRAVAREERSRLPERIAALEPADPRYPVEVSPKLAAWRDCIAAEHRRRK